MAIHSEILYIFRFKNGETKEFQLKFNDSSLELLPHNDKEVPPWAELSPHQCTVCPLDPAIHRYCPTAVHFGWILNELKGHDSFEEVIVEATDDDRSYIKETSLQDGLGSLLGIVMPASGCQILRHLRPMVRYHLPFASLEEIEYRMVSMYLFSQYLRQQKGETPDWSLKGLADVYNSVKEVNQSFSKRLSFSSNGEAAKNALTILDCFAKTVTKAIDNLMKDHHTSFVHN